MVTDYEAAWIELQKHVASKTQHGRSELLVEMAEMAARHRVPAGDVSRLLRLHGVEVGLRDAASAITEPDTREPLGAGRSSDHDLHGPAHHDPGGHDVSTRQTAGHAQLG